MPTTIVQVTEEITIDIAEAPCNAVALYWLTKTGAWPMWVFFGTQTEGIEVGNGAMFEKFITDLANEIGRKQYISKTEVPKIVLGYECLSTAKVNYIKTLMSAIKVLMLISDPNVLPPTFMEVNVEPGSFKIIETENEFHNLELTIELPELFIQEQ